MDANAQLNYLRMSPRKVRLAATLIKGMSVPRAEIELKALSKRAVSPILKLLRSALSNARRNDAETSAGSYYVRSISVNPGPTLKRSRPRARGRASMNRKRTSHIKIVLGRIDDGRKL